MKEMEVLQTRGLLYIQDMDIKKIIIFIIAIDWLIDCTVIIVIVHIYMLMELIWLNIIYIIEHLECDIHSFTETALKIEWLVNSLLSVNLDEDVFLLLGRILFRSTQTIPVVCDLITAYLSCLTFLIVVSNQAPGTLKPQHHNSIRSFERSFVSISFSVVHLNLLLSTHSSQRASQPG